MTPTQQEANSRHKDFAAKIASKAAAMDRRMARLNRVAPALLEKSRIRSESGAPPNMTYKTEAKRTERPDVVLVRGVSGHRVRVSVETIAEAWDMLSEDFYYLSVADIRQAVIKRYRVTDAQLCGESRFKKIATARHVFFYLCSRLTKRGTPYIGRKLGGRDHSTVINGVKRAESRIAADPIFEQEVEKLEAQLLESRHAKIAGRSSEASSTDDTQNQDQLPPSQEAAGEVVGASPCAAVEG